MNARYYVPYIYRTLTPDVIVPDPTNPQSYNRYSYVYNNPVNHTDPSGHCIVDECPWVPQVEYSDVYGEDWSNFTGLDRAEKLMDYILWLERDKWATNSEWLSVNGDITTMQNQLGVQLQNILMKENIEGSSNQMIFEEILQAIPGFASAAEMHLSGIFAEGANFVAAAIMVGTHKDIKDNIDPPLQSHHIIQDAAVRELPGYNYSDAPATPMQGPSTTQGTPHYNATMVQRNLNYGGGNYAAERRIGYRALRVSGYSRAEARFAIEFADQYFFNLGVHGNTSTRIPGNRH